jgi:hypothetical protein
VTNEGKEMKLGSGTKLTDNQEILKTKWNNGNGNSFTTRSNGGNLGNLNPIHRMPT